MQFRVVKLGGYRFHLKKYLNCGFFWVQQSRSVLVWVGVHCQKL